MNHEERLTIFPLQSPRQKDYCKKHFHLVDPHCQTQSLQKCSFLQILGFKLISWVIPFLEHAKKFTNIFQL